jgi:GDP-L-fucose synthase
MKKIFVTGGNGFLGRHLIKNLKNKKFKIFAPSSKELDLTKFRNIKNLKNSFDFVYHLASWTQAGDFCLKYPSDQWIINQEINTNLVKWWSYNGHPRTLLTIIGTSCCYDEKRNFLEKNYMYEKPHSSLQTYAMTKKILLQGAISCQLQKGFNWNCFVPSTLYGSGYKIKNKIPHFIFDLVKKIIRGKLCNEKVILWGNGYQKREIVHVEDFIRNMTFLNQKVKNQIYNLGGDKEKSIRFFAKTICKHLKYDFNQIIFDENKYTGAKGKKLCNNKVKKIIKDYNHKLINIETGIKEMINWHLKEHEY